MGLNLLWSALLIYCFACYAFIFYWVRSPCAEDDENWLIIQALKKEHPVRGWLGLTVASLLCSPLIVPYAVVVVFREEREEHRERRRLLRSHREFSFSWLNPAKLPEEPRSYIEEHTGEMLEQGFQDVGTYIMKTKLPEYYGRVFIHGSGTTVTALCYLNGDQFFSYSTLLESDRVLETSPIEPPKGLLCFTDNPRITAYFVTGAAIGEAYRLHLEKVAEICDQTGDRPLAFSPDLACDVLIYEGRVFSEELFALGRLDARPPAPVLPEGRPVEPEPAPLVDSIV